MKKAKLFVYSLIKRELLTIPKVLYKKFCTRNQFLQIRCFPKYGIFFRLKCQLKQKKLTLHVCKDLPSFSRRGNG